MIREKICGIYCIENLANSKKYIGSSIDIYRRWRQHTYNLKQNKHHSIHLQRAFNYYGEYNFKFYIVLKCDNKQLIEKEQYWMDIFKVCDRNFGYNMALIAGAGHYEGATLEGLKDGKYGISLEQFNNIIYLLQSSDISINEISNILDVNVDSIYKIYNKINYKNLTTDTLFIKRRVDCQYNGHTIITEEQANNIINLLLKGFTVMDIVNKTEVNRSTVSDIKNKNSWKTLTKDIYFPKVKDKHPTRYRPINKYDLEMNLIEHFESITLAKENLGISSHGNLSACLNGKRKTAYGYIWRYSS